MTSREQNVAKAARAVQRRIELVHELAPDAQCAICRKRFHDPGDLHVDHADGRTWSLHTVNRWARVGRYWREHKAGVRLRALCLPCNNRNRPPETASVPHKRRS